MLAKQKVTIIFISLVVACLIVLTCIMQLGCHKHIKIIDKKDGSFEPLELTKVEMASVHDFYEKNGIKPIQLLFRITKPYMIKVKLKDDDIENRTLTIPTMYVTDGVSKPIRCLPIPNEDERPYWVYLNNDNKTYWLQLGQRGPCFIDDEKRTILFKGIEKEHVHKLISLE